jgi:serine/threonine protein kinase
MAPEVIHGRRYGFKADVWSLGTLLFQLLTGSHPFTGKNMKELEQNVKNGEYKIPRDI